MYLKAFDYEGTGIDINDICPFCNKEEILCDCKSTGSHGIYHIIKIYQFEEEE